MKAHHDHEDVPCSSGNIKLDASERDISKLTPETFITESVTNTKSPRTADERHEDNNLEVLFTNEETEDEEGYGSASRRTWKTKKKSNVDLESAAEEMMKDQVDETVPDGGWGWMVVFGASLILVLVDSVGQCFGVIFSRFLLELETSTTVTAWIFNLFSFIWCMTGPPLGPLITEFGWRPLTFVGSVVLTFATVTSAFASAAWVLFFTYSLLAGIGCGIISNISYMIVPHYFTTRRGLANGIIMAWDCGGQLIGPPLINLLQDEYGFAGATLILGGVIFNCCIGAAVFHPVEWHMKPKTPNFRMNDDTRDLVESSKEPSSQSPSQGKEVPQLESPWKVILRLLNSTVKDLAILKSYRAIIISVGATVIFNGYLNFLAFVPFAIQEAGHSLGEAAYCVSVSAICNMLTRVVVASLSDGKMFNFRVSMIIGSLTISGTMVCFTLIQNLTALKVIMGLWGCGVGTFMSIFNLVMVHYMGIDNLMPMMGSSMLCIAFGYLTIGPFAGYIQDMTESYAACIWFLAGVVFMAFLLWLLMPTAVAYDLQHMGKNKASQKNGTEEQSTGVLKGREMNNTEDNDATDVLIEKENNKREENAASVLNDKENNKIKEQLTMVLKEKENNKTEENAANVLIDRENNKTGENAASVLNDREENKTKEKMSNVDLNDGEKTLTEEQLADIMLYDIEKNRPGEQYDGDIL